jgi:hypothetical protein
MHVYPVSSGRVDDLDREGVRVLTDYDDGW